MQPIIFIIYIIAAVSLIALVLLQHGKGADAGAAFGSGASQTMFGSSGSLPFLTKLTAVVAVIFFVGALGLGYFTAKQAKQQEGAVTIPLTSTKQVVPNVPAAVPAPASDMAEAAKVPASTAAEKSSATTAPMHRTKAVKKAKN